MSPVIKKTSQCLLKSQPVKTLMKQQKPSISNPVLASIPSVIRAPTPAYLQLVDAPSSMSLDPLEAARRKKHLLILDLNGTLVSRTKKRNGMFVRPHIDVFLDFIFNHFRVMVWSSAQATSVNHMLYLFGDERRKKLLKAWNRTHFGLSQTAFRNKTPTVKDLERVWQRFTKYSAHSTVILDDSPSKSVLQPFNSIHLNTFDHNSDTFLEHGDQELLSVMDYLKRLRLQTNIPNFMRSTPYASITTTSSLSPPPPPPPPPPPQQQQQQLSNSNKLGEASETENKLCHYYGFSDKKVHEKWDFSKTPAQVEEVESDSNSTMDNDDNTD